MLNAPYASVPIAQPPQRNRFRVKAARRVTLILLVLLIAGAGGAWIDLQQFARRQAGQDDTPVVISVAPGQSFTQLTGELSRHNIISSKYRFRLLARLRGEDKQLKAGEYALASSMTPLQVLDALVRNKVLQYRLTVPEGFNLAQIAAEIARLDLADAAVFKDLVHDPNLAASLGYRADSLEGYLYPETYYFAKDVTPRKIIETMVRRFDAQFPEAWRQRAAQLKMSVHQVVTLASIIEKETGAPQERPLISSVFHNRLKKKMRLESDPTVIYGIKDFDGNLTRNHLITPSPYNTYLIAALPSGPIANPGRAAIEAALFPVQSDFLYFVSKQDGTHTFSRTYREHSAAVRKYQLHRQGQ
ncbi:MAG: endolytic transglycosylase MltG [Desulfatitalea sp.]|nr:endolytic transglycosylase MltG [Desulfatitalea sp.]